MLLAGLVELPSPVMTPDCHRNASVPWAETEPPTTIAPSPEMPWAVLETRPPGRSPSGMNLGRSAAATTPWTAIASSPARAAT